MTSLNARSEPQLRVQINQIDYTLEPPGELDNTRLHQAPVIRIYGASSFGKTTCVHIHQVYPYFYVEYPGELNPIHVRRYTTTLASSLNHAIALSLKRNPDSPRSQYVRAILLVKGIHFYGFHARYSPFLKIYLANPSVVSRVVAILQSGTVMATRFRVFESHLSFILQFMCDFNLYGCGWIDLGEVYLRGVEQLLDNEESSVKAHFTPSPYYCQSRLPLEVDVTAPHILNRNQLRMRAMHHKLEIPEPQPSTEPLISSVRELWEDERRRRSAQGLNPSPDMPLDPSESSRKPGGGWVAEQRWWEELYQRIQREQELVPADDSSSQEWEKWTMSTFESIEALWDREYRTWRPGQGYQAGHSAEGLVMSVPESGDQHAGIQVDADMLSSQEIIHMLQAAEEEGAADAGDSELPEGFHDEIEEMATDGEQEVPQRVKSPDNPFLIDDEGAAEFTLPDLASVDFETDTDPLFKEPHPSRKSTSILATPTHRRVEYACSRTPSTQPQRHSPSLGTLTPSDLEVRPAKRRKIDKMGFPDYVSTSSAPISFVSDISAEIPSAGHSSHLAVAASSSSRYEYKFPPPTTSDLWESLESYDLPQKIYREPYFSRDSDVPRKSRLYAGVRIRLKGGQGVAHLEEWENVSGNNENVESLVTASHTCQSKGRNGWEYASCPPSVGQTKRWLQSHHKFHPTSMPRQHSQIEGPSIINISRMETSSESGSGNIRKAQAMTILSLEVFVPCDDGRMPDPQKDEVVAIFYAFQKDESEPVQTGTIVVGSERLNRNRIRPLPMEEVSSELDLLNMLIDVVVNLDPDILTGWEVQKNSWGYCNARAMHYGYELTELISRAPPGRGTNDYDQWGARHTSTVKVAGRHILNGWRIIRSEQSLHSYTLENVAFHVLSKRVPHFSQSTLTKWYHGMVPVQLAAILRYFSGRTCMILGILNKMEIVSKTAEFARVFGVDFFSVISRGSQFKVESFMFRIAKPENYVLLSPSKSDVGKQNAAECMPLIMEPMSAFYASPLVVLDFQSLYPSVMIAYNYCYSTCLGRVEKYKGRNKFGVVDLDQPPSILNFLKEHIHIAPNGVMYVKPAVRKGLLRRMLIELLETRVMVKHAMRSRKDNKSLLRVLDARQLGLKYISNVTYGYTSATYSGRMPAVEIADSIVQAGRETLEKAISVINSTKKWGAQVVYGDTDSVFVHLPGKTREQAFRIGSDMADTITALNPSPIKLKFEKVYHPCVLMAKKRYVGFKYESPDQMEPAFDAKGIETVRRDGVFAQQKMTEKCLKILFRSQDLSEIKSYCYRSWTKLMEDRASVQDFIFHKEVKMGTYSDKGLPPPGVVVAARRMLLDPGDEPQYGERVPYVIVRGPPGSRLVDRAMDPLEFMQNSRLRLDATYYITRVLIPPLERILNLVGVDVRQWFTEMPKPSQVDLMMSPRKSMKSNDSPSRVRIHDHFLASQCLACFGPTSENGLCNECRSTPQETGVKLGYRIRSTTNRVLSSHLVCNSCTTSAQSEPAECDSVDCPWFFTRKKAENQAQFLPIVEESYRDPGVQPPVLYVIDEDSD